MITRSPVKPTRTRPSGIPAKRAPTPLRSTPVATATASILTSSTATGSTATPHEAMVASQLAHINDLVQQNRSLEQTIKKLDEDLAKSAADVIALNAERKSWDGDRKTWMGERQKWMDERKAWAEGCDTMQACHRIQQYRVACPLHDERVVVLKMQEAARMEQLKRLQRDYKITMFQAREAELEAQIDQVEELRDDAVEVRAYYEKSAQELKARSAALATDVKSKTAEVQAAHRQCAQAEDDLRRLREAHADATATSTAASTKLTRLTTERDALEAQVTSLKRSVELAQDETTQFRTQLANWQKLKKGEDADAEEARKKKVELEQELKEARRRISEFETRAGETEMLEANLQKQKDRVEKLKHVLDEWKVEAREQTTARETAETQLTGAQEQITTLEQKIVELQTQLSIASKPKSSNKKGPPPAEPAQSDEELGVAPSPPSTSTLPTKVKDKSSKPASTSKPSSSRPTDVPAKPRSKPRPLKKSDPIPELQDSDIEIIEGPLVPSAAPEKNTKAKGKQKAAHDDDIGSDIEKEIRKHKKGKTKDAEKVETREPTKTNKVARPKKNSPGDEADETHPKAKSKVNSRKRTSPDPPKKSKVKSSQPKEDSEDATAAEPDVAPKKKKRKINLFGGSQPATFDWNSLGPTGEGLGIPTRLSPMKETDVIPRRLGRGSKS